MSQHDMIVSNASGAAVRADVNSALAALASTSKGNSRPSTVYAGQLWLDDNTPSATEITLNLFDGADDIPLGTFDITTNKFKLAAGSVLVTSLHADFSGTYTPTLTNITNIDASTAYQCQWSRIGSVVTVSGKVDIDTAAGGNTNTVLQMTVPVSSTLSAAHHAGGTAACITTMEAAAIYADTANNVGIRWPSQGTNNRTFHFNYTYLIS